jgi:hypothetical protein
MMVEFIYEPVAVEVQLRPDGAVKLLAFAWRGRRFQVQSWGREGEETRDGHAVRCYLVQTAGPQTWELCQEIETAHWLLARRWAVRTRTI